MGWGSAMNHYLKRLLSFLSPLMPRAEQLVKVSDFLMSTGDGHLNMFKDLSLVRSCCKYICPHNWILSFGINTPLFLQNSEMKKPS